ncbi:MAG: hypothetical protein AB7Q00_11385 [Phycisphaerales bacterium]
MTTILLPMGVAVLAIALAMSGVFSASASTGVSFGDEVQRVAVVLGFMLVAMGIASAFDEEWMEIEEGSTMLTFGRRSLLRRSRETLDTRECRVHVHPIVVSRHGLQEAIMGPWEGYALCLWCRNDVVMILAVAKQEERITRLLVGTMQRLAPLMEEPVTGSTGEIGPRGLLMARL